MFPGLGLAAWLVATLALPVGALRSPDIPAASAPPLADPRDQRSRRRRSSRRSLPPRPTECVQLRSNLTSQCQNKTACKAWPLDRKPSAGGNCTWTIHGCVDFIQGIAVMRHNSVYRVSDIVQQLALKYRPDSVSILASPEFRGTVLREVLVRTSTYDGRLLEALSDARVESLAQGTNEGGPGYACTTGRRGTSEEGGLVLAGSDRLREELKSVLLQRFLAGRCAPRALATDLVLQLRLGDHRKRWQEAASAVAAMRETATNRVVLSGVVSYGGYRDYIATNKSVEESVAVFSKLRKFFQAAGIQTTVHSVPDVDADLCYLVFAPNLLQLGSDGHFVQLVRQIRDSLPASVFTETGHRDWLWMSGAMQAYVPLYHHPQ